MTTSLQHSARSLRIQKFLDGALQMEEDWLAVEEPLEINLEYGQDGARMRKNLSVTMRTPGADADLVRGFLCTEGIVRQASDILELRTTDGLGNVVQVSLAPQLQFDMQQLERHFYTTSSCGVCGKTSIEAVMVAAACGSPAPVAPWNGNLLGELPARLRLAQETFEATGGLHASALFDRKGQLIALREDVGRHNALDKLVGWALTEQLLPLHNQVLLLSGRASFELLQKAAMAGVRVVCAVGAPSSLAASTADALGICLVGFLKTNRFNIYSHAEYLIFQ
jgi:FdhD protein